MSSFSERLKEVRKQRGDTQEDFSSKIGFSLSTIRKWEQGATEPDLNTLTQICELYHVSSDYLLSLTEIDQPTYLESFQRLSREHQRTLRLFEAFLAQTSEAQAESK